jgi:sodium-dependent dicarboxylate transporter 2/3/5|tara:strand:- start:1621 stop:2994 length:1374 start_codon:yes stop_codon:yes gene_type:complete
VSLKQLALPAGPILALLAGYLIYASGFSPEAAVTLGVTVNCVLWWVFAPIPIPVTSLLPLALLPLFGVLSATQVGASYGHPLVLLLLGGFILATALEKSGAHHRIAIAMVNLFGGTSSRRLVLGFMAAAAVLSMWISNTATTLMLMPVALAVIERAEDEELSTPLLLGIAYAASVGGIGTPIGTPPNVVFMAVYSDTMGEEFGFARWMTIGVPIVLVMLPAMGWWLTRNLSFQGHVQLPHVGSWQTSEKRVMIVFSATALAWITRKEPFGGWTALFDFPYSNDAIVAFVAVIAMFLTPDGKGEKLLDWESANRIPWGMLILFGGGIAIAQAFTSSGLSETIGSALSGVSTLHVLALMGVICLSVTFLTETTSNTATTTLLMPILAAAALGAGMDPKLFMIPAAISASCAFMLPVATAPNVIVFSTERFPPQTMAREGFALNLIGVILISSTCYMLLA